MWAIDESELSVEANCLWPIVGDCPLQADQMPEIVDAANQMAIEILHAASGRQFGECVATFQPCRRTCTGGDAWTDMWHLLDVRSATQIAKAPWSDSYYSLMVCANCSTDDCACSDLVDVQLWHRSITDIMSVQVDGVELDPGDYRLWRNRLIRTDGQAWPDCQDPTVPNGSVGTWSVSYRHGRPVPAGGQVAAGILACELAKSLCGDTTCALPKRVQSITRQGVSVAFLDPQTFLDEGKTGIYAVDLWLHQVNPNRLKRRARAFSAMSRRRKVTRDRTFDPFPGS